MIVNMVADNSVSSAPSGFTTAIQNAANLIGAAFSNNITINIRYGWGSYNNVIDNSLTGSGGALGGFLQSSGVNYSTAVSWLNANRTSADDNTAVASLPASASSLPNQNTILVASATAKALGHYTGSSTAIDGAMGFGTSVASQNWTAVALHEITHAMGRINNSSSNPTLMDLFRYDAAGHFQWTQNSSSGAPAYFSIDGGVTRLANFSTTSDTGDLVNDSLAPNDSFDAFYSNATLSTLTTMDLRMMDAIGFTRAGASGPPSKVVKDDFNGDGTSDVLLQLGGTVVDWTIKNGAYQSGNTLTTGATGFTVVGKGDVNGDGTADIVLQSGGTVVDWIMKNGAYQSGNILTTAASGWTVVGTGDYNGDGTSDVMLQNGNTVVDWTMQNGLYQSGSVVTTAAGGFAVK